MVNGAQFALGYELPVSQMARLAICVPAVFTV